MTSNPKHSPRGRGRRREDRPLYRFVFPMLMGLALAGMAVFGYQLFSWWQDQNRIQHLERTSNWAADTVSAELEERRERVAALAASDRVRSLLEDGAVGTGSDDRLESAVTGARDVALFPATVDERDVTGFPGLDFATLDLIWTFLDDGKEPPAEIHMPGSDRSHLAIVMPVSSADGNTLLGFVRADFPVAPVYGLLDEARITHGYLGLVQGEGGWRNVELRGLGDSSRPGAGDLEVRRVPGSRLQIAYGYRPGFAPLGQLSPALMWGGLIGCTLLLVGLTALRLYLPALQIKVQERRDQAERRALGIKEPPPEPATPGPAEKPAQPEPEPAPPPAKPAAPDIAESLFRAYDIRGVVDETLTRDAVRWIGRAIGSEALDRGVKEIVVARDGRHSGSRLVEALAEGLMACGCSVIDIGAVPTPVLYFATHHLRTYSGVMVTGSHNPPQYNGLKIVLNGETLAEDSIADLRRRIGEGRLHEGEGGRSSMEITQEYLDRISGDIQLQRPIKVVLDAGNGIAGAVAPGLMRAIGAEPVPLYCEVDGDFPNHHPDPSVPENLTDLIDKVAETGAELGLAFDGDGDRLGVVTPSGANIYPDRLMMLFSRDVLTRNPGAAIIFDVKCSGRLADQIVEMGGSPIMWKTGHSLIKAKLKESGAMLAGEMSGHFFFTERWYGFDDGLYAGCRLLEVLAAEPGEPGDVLEGLPTGVSTPELRVEMAEGEHFDFLEKFEQRAHFEDARLTTIDGVRADFPYGWGLVRCSNTTPCLVLRFEGDNQESLELVQEAFRSQLLAVDPGLQLPF